MNLVYRKFIPDEPNTFHQYYNICMVAIKNDEEFMNILELIYL